MFKCEQCLSVFTRKDALVRHMKTHDGYQIVCSICSKKFSRKDALVRHMKTHDGYQIVCSICSKKFFRKDALVRHMKTHDGYQIVSSICSKKFSRKDALSRHMKSIHAVARVALNRPDEPNGDFNDWYDDLFMDAHAFDEFLSQINPTQVTWAPTQSLPISPPSSFDCLDDTADGFDSDNYAQQPSWLGSPNEPSSLRKRRIH